MKGNVSFVIFPLGERRFALPAEMVAELSRPDRLYAFPHTTEQVAGVLLRRGRILAVYEVAELLVGEGAPARRFYLIVNLRFGEAAEWTAIPVSGECELVTATLQPAPAKMPGYVTGLLSWNGRESVEVLDLQSLIDQVAARDDAGAPNKKQSGAPAITAGAAARRERA